MQALSAVCQLHGNNTGREQTSLTERSVHSSFTPFQPASQGTPGPAFVPSCALRPLVRDKPQVALLETVKIRTPRNKGSSQVRLGDIIVEDAGDNGNCAFTYLSSAAKEAAVTMYIEPTCNSVVKGPENTQFLTRTVSNQVSGGVSVGCKGVDSSKQRQTVCAHSEASEHLQRCVMLSSRTHIQTPTDARVHTHSSYFTKLKSFLQAFFPHKGRANPWSTRKGTPPACGVQPRLVRVAPKSVFIHSEAERISDAKPRSAPKSTKSPYQPFSQLTHVSDQKEPLRSSASTLDPPSIFSPSGQKFLDFGLCGPCESTPSSSCETRASIASSTCFARQRDTLDQHAFQHDNAEATTAFATLIKNGCQAGTTGEGSGKRFKPGYSKTQTKCIPVSTGKPAVAQGAKASCADAHDELLVNTSRRNEAANRAEAQAGLGLHDPVVPHLKAQRKTPVVLDVSCAILAKVKAETRHNDGTAVNISSEGKGLGTAASLTSDCHGQPRQRNVRSVMDIFKHMAEGDGGISQCDPKRTSEMMLTADTRKVYTWHAFAVHERCKAAAATRPARDVITCSERIGAGTVSLDVYLKRPLLSSVTEGGRASGSGCGSAPGGSTAGGPTHTESHCSSCVQLFSPVEHFLERASSPVAQAHPAMVTKPASLAWKQSSLSAGHDWPTKSNSEERECYPLSGTPDIRASSAASSMLKLLDACAANTASARVTGDGGVSLKAMTEVSKVATSVPSLSKGVARRVSEAGCLQTAGRARPVRSVENFKTENPKMSVRVSTVSLSCHQFPQGESATVQATSQSHPFEERRESIAEREQSFQTPRVKPADPVGYDGRSRTQGTPARYVPAGVAQAAPDSQKMSTVVDVARIPCKEGLRQAWAQGTSLLVDLQVEYASSGIPTPRDRVRHAAAGGRLSTDTPTRSRDNKETRIYDCKSSSCATDIHRFSTSLRKCVRRPTSSRISSRDSWGQRAETPSKLLPFVRSFNRDDPTGWLGRRHKEQQQPDILGGSVPFSPQQAGKVVAGQTSRIQQEGAAGSENFTRNQEYCKSVKRRGSSLPGIGGERPWEERTVYLGPTSGELKQCGRLKEADVPTAAVVLDETSAPDATTEARNRLPPWLSRRQVETTKATTSVADASGVAPQRTAVAADNRAPTPITVAETSAKVGSITPLTTPVFQELSVAPNQRALATLSAPCKKVIKDVRTTRWMAARAASHGRSGAGDARRREGVHCLLPLSWSAVVPRLKAKAGSIRKEQHEKHVQQQEEHISNRPHVWNGDYIYLNNPLDATTAPQNVLLVGAERRILPSSGWHTPNTLSESEMHATGSLKGHAAFPLVHELSSASPFGSTRAPPLVVEAGSAVYEAPPVVTAALFQKCDVSASTAYKQSTLERDVGSYCGSVEAHGTRSTTPACRRFFSADLPTRSAKESAAASSFERSILSRNRLERMVSCPPFLAVYTSTEATLSQRQPLQDSNGKGLSKLNAIKGFRKDLALYQQQNAGSASAYNYHTLQLRPITAISARSVSAGGGRDDIFRQFIRSSVILVLRPRSGQLHEQSIIPAEQGRRCHRWGRASSLRGVVEEDCDRVKCGVNVHLEQRFVMREKQKKIMHAHQNEARCTQAAQRQKGVFLSSPLQQGPRNFAEKRSSASVLFQRQKTAVAPCRSWRRTMSLDMKHVHETNKSVGLRERPKGVETLLCNSESDTTRCGTSCGEDEVKETSIVLPSARMSALRLASGVALGESPPTNPRTYFIHHLQKRDALPKRRTYTDTSQVHAGRNNPGYTCRSSCDTTTADGRISAGRRKFCVSCSCGTGSFADARTLPSAPDHSMLLHRLSSAASTAQCSHSANTTNHPDSSYEEPAWSMAVSVARKALPCRSESSSVSSRTYACSPPVLHIMGSTSAADCSKHGGMPQETIHDELAPPVGSRKKETTVDGQTGNAVAGPEFRYAHEEFFSEHEEDGTSVNTPTSSTRSVVFTVEDTACEELADDGHHSLAGLLPLPQQNQSQGIQQRHGLFLGAYDDAARPHIGGKNGIKPRSCTAAFREKDYREDVPDGRNLTLLDCREALDTYWRESTREVDVYLPSSLYNLAQTALCNFFDARELSACQEESPTLRLKAALAPVSSGTTATKMGGIPERDGEAGRRKGAGEHTIAGTAATGYRMAQGAVPDVFRKRATLQRQGTKRAFTEQKSTPILLPGQAYMHQHISDYSLNGNSTSIQRCIRRTKSADAFCNHATGKELRCSEKIFGEIFLGNVCISSSCSTGDGRIRYAYGRLVGELGRSDTMQWTPAHVKDILPETVSTTCLVNASGSFPVVQRHVLIAHSTGVKKVSLVEKSKRYVFFGSPPCWNAAPSSVPVLSGVPTSCAAADVIVDSIGQPADHVTGTGSPESLYAAVAEAPEPPEWRRAELYGARARASPHLECKRAQLSEKQQPLYMERRQEQPDEKQQSKQHDTKQQQDCDLWKREQQQLSPQWEGQTKHLESAYAREQPASGRAFVLHCAQGHRTCDAVASDDHQADYASIQGCPDWQSGRSAEASFSGCTAAERAHNGDTAARPGDGEAEAAYKGNLSSAKLVEAEGLMTGKKAAGNLAHHKEHKDQDCACNPACSPACNKEQYNTPCSQKRGSKLIPAELAAAKREGLEAKRRGAVIVQVKFSSLLLVLCDGNEALFSNLPYFEGPLCLSVKNEATTRLRQQPPSYSRLLKSVVPGAAHADRLFYFVLSRGHLFWFTERSAFTSRGFEACVGSVSLLLTACRLVCLEEPKQRQQPHKSLLCGGGLSNASDGKCRLSHTHAAAPLDAHGSNHRFSLQFYTDAGPRVGVDTSATLHGNIRRGSGMSTRGSLISGANGNAKENATAGCLFLGELKFHVVSGAVFCPTAPVQVMECERGTFQNPVSSAISAENNSDRLAPTTSDALLVYVTGRGGTSGPTADDITPLAPLPSSVRTTDIKTVPNEKSSGANAFCAAPAASLPAVTVRHMREVRSIREGSTTVATAAASALSSFGQHGAGRSGRRSAQKKAVVASYTAAWVRHMQNSITQGENLRRRFTQVDWPQHQLRARLVASRCGVFQ